MLHKTKRPYESLALEPAQRFKRNVIDLYAGNVLSASRTAELLEDAAGAGIQACSLGSRPVSKSNKSRSLRRKLSKGSAWPSLYECPVRVWDTKTTQVVVRDMSFWLPHEVVASLAKNASSMENIFDRTSLDPQSLQHLLHCQEQAPARLVAVGLWGDAAPCNWDRIESLQVFSLNLPGLSGEGRNLRVPITALSKKSVATADTYDDILAVVAWSLQCLALGKYPQCRHDETDWQPADAQRLGHQQVYG